MRPERVGAIGISVVKVGGSLAADAPRLRAVLSGIAEGRDGPGVIVPGGGPFADAVRAAQDALGFGDPLAHRLALDAMGRMAEVFCALEPRLAIVRSEEAAAAALSRGGVAVWDPVALRAGIPGIAENWDVTSDSLALWLAARLRAARCILVKSAPCPAGSDASALARLGLVDRAFPDFARRFDGAIVIRGPGNETVVERAVESSSSHPHPHPEVRGEAEPRRSPPEASLRPGGLLRGPLTRAPQDEGENGIGARAHRSGIGDAAA